METIHRSTFIRKLSTSLVGGITAIALILMLGNGGNIPWFPGNIVFLLAGIILFSSIIFPIYWQVKEKREGHADSSKVYTKLHDIIKYCLAFNVASFGWKKIFGLQFIVPTEIASQPMNTQTGECLTWYYFGHSVTFGIIIALLQLSGALLILLDRTHLLGLFILLGVMLNLTLINIFYGMNPGAIVQSVSISVSLIFLLALHSQKLIAFFFSQQSTLRIANGIQFSLLRLSAIVLSLLFTIYLASL